ncbi:tRNA dihydrouridine(20/20a) synthase DusA [Wukongibacter baidiensis]|uniref:tRNA dihydrouridine(20/20a) synthase DusA n=1 Tax=Wukongibacter baidiensis TaxID=1723361 RepID=UPI003D7F5A9D
MDNYISKIKTPSVSIAPMVDKTVKHFRYFCRIITKKSLLYTEMISTYAIKHGDRRKILDFDSFEKPLALQIAGSDPKEVYEAVKIAEDWDYDEINLNVGCPSDKVSGHCMGAVLMAYPELVAEMVSSIRKATKKPITVKHRIGIDGKNILPLSFNKTLFDRYEDMENFIKIVSKAGVDRFTIHARIAILAGLNPKENREIPPLRYEDVYKLKKNYRDLNIEINGGIKTLSEIEKHLKYVDGVMIGRIAYKDPFMLSKVDKVFDDGQIHNITRREIIERMIPYVEKVEDRGNWHGYSALQHMFGLFHNKKGSKEWRNIITPPWQNGYTARDILIEALKTLPQEILNETPIIDIQP